MKIGKLLSLVLVTAIAVTPAFSDSNVKIVNGDAPGVGFNDPTPVAPIGGNWGTTLGQQRMIALQHAADIWGATLNSHVPIRVLATWVPRPCTANSAVLASAGARTIWRDFRNATFTNTWYGAALANKIASRDLAPGPKGKDAWIGPDDGRKENLNADEIRARFNVSLGGTNPDGTPCFVGGGWYLGLDNNHGTFTDLIATALHEFGHGLGFQTFVDNSTGQRADNRNDIYMLNLRDNTTGKMWPDMTDAERMASAINTGNLVWTGANVTAASSTVLTGPSIVVAGAPLNATYIAGNAGFGPVPRSPGVTAAAVLVNDGVAPGSDACTTPFVNAAAVSGNVAVMDRGTCTFAVKAQNAQAAGAAAVIIVNNAAGPAPALGGFAAGITIPVISLSLADGTALKNAMASNTVTVSVTSDPNQLAGADAQGRVKMNAPNPLQPGSSVSHWDPATLPNQLMEPAINGNLTHSVVAPEDLTYELMKDIGW
ncbi:MAG TPA: PA domain-containing protein [Clostridia bacterium]|nr:PA domain-containing protein [Clostridia bacterium]